MFGMKLGWVLTSEKPPPSLTVHQNFMKCVMRMFAEGDKGVIFYETVLTLKHQKHTFIECVPVPWADYEVLPGYFRVSELHDPRHHLLTPSRSNLF